METTDGALVLALLLPVEVFPEECFGGLGSLCCLLPMPIMSMGECLKAAHYIPEICEIISEKVDGEIGCSECSNSQSSFQNLTS